MKTIISVLLRKYQKISWTFSVATWGFRHLSQKILVQVIFRLFLAAVLVLSSVSCATVGYKSYSTEFYDVFDTVTIITAYAKNQDEFNELSDTIHDEMLRLHKLYDIYNDYDGINNIKTINDNAGIKAVKVHNDIIDLLVLGKDAHEKTEGVVNIALGAVLKIWHDCRESAYDSPETAVLPNMAELKAASANTDINDIVIDKSAGTVFLKNPEMLLDVGSIAKGYAVELAGAKARECGFNSGIINAGGNIYTAGMPMNKRNAWSIGVQNPFAVYDDEQLVDAIYVSDVSIVSSGNYQRFFEVDGVIYHHLIDPETLMPANRYSGVTVIHKNSDIADILSTAIYILPIEEGMRILEAFGGEAIWISNDKEFTATEGYKAVSRLYGAKNN